MKSLFNSYIAVLFVALVSFSSCTQEVVEPMQPATATYTENNEAANRNGASAFKNGDYIVQFQNDPSLNLNTNQDIINLANSITNAQLSFTDVYNFEGFKGFAAYLTKQQAFKLSVDSRVLAIEPDGPIAPIGGE